AGQHVERVVPAIARLRLSHRPGVERSGRIEFGGGRHDAAIRAAAAGLSRAARGQKERAEAYRGDHLPAYPGGFGHAHGLLFGEILNGWTGWERMAGELPSRPCEGGHGVSNFPGSQVKAGGAGGRLDATK